MRDNGMNMANTYEYEWNAALGECTTLHDHNQPNVAQLFTLPGSWEKREPNSPFVGGARP